MALTPPALDGARALADLVRLVRDWGTGLVRSLRLPALSERGNTVTFALTTGANAISHGLGARPAGWLVLRVEGAAGVTLAETGSDARTLRLVSSGSATVTLWVWP